MSRNFTSGKPEDPAAQEKGMSMPTSTRATAQAPTSEGAVKPTSTSVGAPSAASGRTGSTFNAPPIAHRMIKCPKCSADAREVARFCPRCHATLRFECPACKHEQRKGGVCEKCGVNFEKYITAVVAAKKVEVDQVHERIERRTGIIKQVFLLPITGGLSLIKYFFRPSSK